MNKRTENTPNRGVKNNEDVLRVEHRARPEHPGALLREIVLPATDFTQTDLAERLGVSRRTVNMILNEQRPITVDMAHRLSRIFNTSAKYWMNMQQDLDIWEALHEHKEEYDQLMPFVEREAYAA